MHQQLRLLVKSTLNSSAGMPKTRLFSHHQPALARPYTLPRAIRDFSRGRPASSSQQLTTAMISSVASVRSAMTYSTAALPPPSPLIAAAGCAFLQSLTRPCCNPPALRPPYGLGIGSLFEVSEMALPCCTTARSPSAAVPSVASHQNHHDHHDDTATSMSGYISSWCSSSILQGLDVPRISR